MVHQGPTNTLDKEGSGKGEMGQEECFAEDSDGVGGTRGATVQKPCQLTREGRCSSDLAEGLRGLNAARSPQLQTATGSRQQAQAPAIRSAGARGMRGRGALRPKAAPKISNFFSSRARDGALTALGRAPEASVLVAGSHSAGGETEGMEVEDEVKGPGMGEGEGGAGAEADAALRQGLGCEGSPRDRERAVHAFGAGEAGSRGGGECTEPRHAHSDLEAQEGQQMAALCAAHGSEAAAQEAPVTAVARKESLFASFSHAGPAAGRGLPADNAAEGRTQGGPALAQGPLGEQAAEGGGPRGGRANDEGLWASAQANQPRSGVPQDAVVAEQVHSGSISASEEGVLHAHEGQGTLGKGSSMEGFDLGSVDVQEQARILEAIRGRNGVPAGSAGASQARTTGPSRAPSRIGGSRNAAKGNKKAPAASIKGYFLPNTRG